MFQDITELKCVRLQKKRLLGIEASLSQPRLTDTSFIPRLLELFMESASEAGLPTKREKRLRKQFIFIVLYLFSPSTLAGGKIATGLRSELIKLYNLASPTSVSNICTKVSFWYDQYRDFRREVDMIYSRLSRKLEECNKLRIS